VLFLTVYWLVLLGLRNAERRRQAASVSTANAAQKRRLPVK